MPLNDTLVPTASSDVVAILDQNFNQLFPSARPMKVRALPNSKPMEHPLEKGAVTTDHRIILPTEIEVAMVLPAPDYRSTFEQINQVFLAGTLLIVQTRTTTYQNMLIKAPPFEETGDMYDAIPLVIQMREVQYVAPQQGTLPASVVKNPVQQSTVSTGQQQVGSDFTLPAPEVNGAGSVLPQVPPAAPRSLLTVPNPFPPAINSQQYTDIYGAAGIGGAAQ